MKKSEQAVEKGKQAWYTLAENKRTISVVLAAIYGALLFAFPGNEGLESALKIVVPLLIGAGFMPSDIEQRRKRDDKRGK